MKVLCREQIFTVCSLCVLISLNLCIAEARLSMVSLLKLDASAPPRLECISQAVWLKSIPRTKHKLLNVFRWSSTSCNRSFCQKMLLSEQRKIEYCNTMNPRFKLKTFSFWSDSSCSCNSSSFLMDRSDSSKAFLRWLHSSELSSFDMCFICSKNSRNRLLLSAFLFCISSSSGIITLNSSLRLPVLWLKRKCHVSEICRMLQCGDTMFLSQAHILCNRIQ